MTHLKRVWLLTGEPGVGKTTALLKAVNLVKSRGYSVGGVISREVRERGVRMGFELLDLGSGSRGTLASSKLSTGPRIGKYRVDLRDVAAVGAKALLDALEYSDVVVCDEIGPMELFSPEFRRAVESVLSSSKPVVGILHKRLRDSLTEKAKNLADVDVIEITLQNREKVPEEVAKQVLGLMEVRQNVGAQ